MRFVFYSVDSKKKLHLHIVDNMTRVNIVPAKDDKTDMYAFTSDGKIYVFEGMNISTAQKYIDKMNKTGCMNLTDPLDRWMYLASECA